MYYGQPKISKHLSTRLKKHGLTCRISKDEVARNPMKVNESKVALERITIGIHVPSLGLINEDRGHAYINSWCQKTLDCGIDDILYMVVRQSEGRTYETSKLVLNVVEPAINDMPHTGSMQIVYLKKSDALIDYQVDEITPDIVEKVKERFVSEINEYVLWANKQVYFVEVESYNAEVSDSVGNIYNHKEFSIEEAIDGVVDDLVVEIDSSPQTITLHMDVDLDQMHEDDDPELYLADLINNGYGFTLTVGTVAFDYDKHTLVMNVLLSELPIFLFLATYSKNNLFKLMRDNYPDVDSVIDLTDKVPYSSWTNETFKALFSSLIDDLSVKGWQVTSVERTNP